GGAEAPGAQSCGGSATPRAFPPGSSTVEPHARSSSPLAVLSTCALLALAGAGCGSSDKIGSVSDPTGAATPKPTTKFSAAGGLVSVSGKAGKGQNGNGNGSGGGGGDNGGGSGGG